MLFFKQPTYKILWFDLKRHFVKTSEIFLEIQRSDTEKSNSLPENEEFKATMANWQSKVLLGVSNPQDVKLLRLIWRWLKVSWASTLAWFPNPSIISLRTYFPNFQRVKVRWSHLEMERVLQGRSWRKPGRNRPENKRKKPKGRRKTWKAWIKQIREFQILFLNWFSFFFVHSYMILIQLVLSFSFSFFFGFDHWDFAQIIEILQSSSL